MLQEHARFCLGMKYRTPGRIIKMGRVKESEDIDAGMRVLAERVNDLHSQA